MLKEIQLAKIKVGNFKMFGFCNPIQNPNILKLLITPFMDHVWIEHSTGIDRV